VDLWKTNIGIAITPDLCARDALFVSLLTNEQTVVVTAKHETVQKFAQKMGGKGSVAREQRIGHARETETAEPAQFNLFLHNNLVAIFLSLFLL